MGDPLFSDIPLLNSTQPKEDLMKPQDGDELENISLEQIEIEVDKLPLLNEVQADNGNEHHEEVKKINNFINEDTDVDEDQKVQLLNQQQQDHEETQSLTKDITAGIFEKVIFAVEDKPKETKSNLALIKKQPQLTKKQKKALKAKTQQKQTHKSEEKHESSPIPSKYQGQSLKLEVYPPTP